MPYSSPTVQAMYDHLGGLTPLDANPYTPDSPAAHAWVAAMQDLQDAADSLPKEILPIKKPLQGGA